MNRVRLLVVCAFTGYLLAGVGSVYADARSDAKEQVQFGVSIAQRGLWTEALYRFKRATEIDQSYAAAFNNLAIAYEQEGELALALESYERAVELDSENAMIRQNYELFREINDRAEQDR